MIFEKDNQMWLKCDHCGDEVLFSESYFIGYKDLPSGWTTHQFFGTTERTYCPKDECQFISEQELKPTIRYGHHNVLCMAAAASIQLFFLLPYVRCLEKSRDGWMQREAETGKIVAKLRKELDTKDRLILENLEYFELGSDT